MFLLHCGFGEILRNPCPGSREGVREGVVLTAQEAGLVEAVAFTLHLLSEVHGLLAHPTLLPSSPVWHPAGESTVRHRGRALWGRGGTAGAGTGAAATSPYPHEHSLQGWQRAEPVKLRGSACSSASCLLGTTGPVCQEQQKSLSWSCETSRLLSVPGKERKATQCWEAAPTITQAPPEVTALLSPHAMARVTVTEPWCWSGSCHTPGHSPSFSSLTNSSTSAAAGQRTVRAVLGAGADP